MTTEIDEVYRLKSITYLEAVVDGVEAQRKQDLVYRQIREQRKAVKLLSRMDDQLCTATDELNAFEDKFAEETMAFREKIVRELDARRQNIETLRMRRSNVDEEFETKKKRVMSIDKSIRKLEKRWRKRMFVQLDDVMKSYPLNIGTTFVKWQEGKEGIVYKQFEGTFKFLDFASWKEEADETEELFASDFMTTRVEERPPSGRRGKF